MYAYWVGRAQGKAAVRQHLDEWPRAQNKPWVLGLLVDPRGYVWAQQYEPFWSNVPRTWEVFDPGGRHVAAIRMPAGLEARHVSVDAVAGVWTDEFGVEHVRVYTLRRG